MRVVVADDSVILREGLSRLLEEVGIEVAGLAGDGAELLALVEQLRPDVAIVDIRMPPTHTDEGLQAARTIRERWPGTGILVLSQYVRPSYALELLANGSEGVGYLLKDRVSDLDELAAMAEGLSNRAIGERLWISENTVEKHVKSIFGKLQLPATADDHRRVLAVVRFLDTS